MHDLREIAGTVLSWAKEREFRGFDPYDGLNSRIIGPLTRHSRFLRLLSIQLVRNCPFNLRRLLLVPPGYNPKGLALFLSGLGYFPDIDVGDTSRRLQQNLLGLASKPDGSPVFSSDRRIRADISLEEVEASEALGWGYNFPWQGRAFCQPAWFPTAVCSSFVLDSFQAIGSDLYPVVSRKVARFVHQTLNTHEDETGICFSYSPRDTSRVFNASLFAAKILARAMEFDEENNELYRDLAERACSYVIVRQKEDGSWVYGEADHWQWVDNLHTGFVLETLSFLAEKLDVDGSDLAIEKGLRFYKENLFEKDWAAKYYSNSTFPLDPHSYAQAAITFTEVEKYNGASRDISEAILNKAIEDLWDNRRNGFIFRKYRVLRNSTVFLRWSQGWMFKAMCRFIGDCQ